MLLGGDGISGGRERERDVPMAKEDRLLGNQFSACNSGGGGKTNFGRELQHVSSIKLVYLRRAHKQGGRRWRGGESEQVIVLSSRGGWSACEALSLY